jgi:hypothetical protein
MERMHVCRFRNRSESYGATREYLRKCGVLALPRNPGSAGSAAGAP